MSNLNNDMSRRHFLQILGVGAGAVGLASIAGCTTAGGGGGGGNKNATSFALTSYMGSEKANAPFFDYLVSSYTKSHDVKIKQITYPFDSYNSPVLLHARSGDVHGAAQVSIADVATFAAAGVLADLSSAAAKYDYTQVGLQGCSYQGKVYALPWTIDAIGMVANQLLLERANVQIPTTVDEFEKALVVLKKVNGVTPYAGATKGDSLKDLLQWMRTFGASVFADGKVTLGDQQSVEALKWYKSLVDRKLVALDVDRPDMRVLFGRGTAAFYEDAVQAKAFAKALPGADPKIAENTMPLSRPVLKQGDTPHALLHGFGLMVFKGEASEPATQFAEYATTQKAPLDKFIDITGLPPATKSGLASPKVSSDPFQKAWADKITATASPDPFWQYPQYAAILKAFEDSVSSALTGQTAAKSALTSAASQMQKLINGK